LTGRSPREIVKIARGKSFRDEFIDFVHSLEKHGKAGSYIARFKKVLQPWLAYNNVNVKLKVNIVGELDTPTLVDERVPSKDELDRIIRMATPRGRVSIALIAFSGLRPGSLGNYNGTDGIKMSDLAELNMNGERMEFERTPSILTVRKNLSKARHQYFTFVSEQSMMYIREYLENRIKKGEKLDRNSPLLVIDVRSMKRNFFLMTTLVTRDIKEAITKAGFSWRPYVLRAYFDTDMIIAESKGKLSHPYLQFMMGHKGDIEARYSTNKGVLPPDMVEDMRKCYKECESFLSTIARPLEQSSIMKEAKLEALKSIAKNLLGIDLMEVKMAKEKEVQRELTPDEEIEVFENEIKKMRDAKRDPQISVREEE